MSVFADCQDETDFGIEHIKSIVFVRSRSFLNHFSHFGNRNNGDQAGLEHLARGTTSGMDQFIVVIEPGSRSIQTYRNVKRLAHDLGVRPGRVLILTGSAC